MHEGMTLPCKIDVCLEVKANEQSTGQRETQRQKGQSRRVPASVVEKGELNQGMTSKRREADVPRAWLIGVMCVAS